MIDSKDQEINIKDLVIEEPQKPDFLTFDPKKDLTQEDLLAMRAYIKKSKNESLIKGAAMYQFLTGDKSIQQEVRDTDWNNIAKQFYHQRFDTKDELEIGDLLEIVPWMKTLFPERLKELSIDNQGLKECLKRDNIWREKVNHNATIFRNEFTRMMLLPSDQDRYKPTDELYRYLRGTLGRFDLFIQSGNDDIPDPMIAFYAFNLAAAKIVYPEIFESLNLSESNWSAMRHQLDRLRIFQVDKDSFLELAFAMTILAADEVKITENGLEIINNPKNIEDQTAPLPAVRRF